MSYYVSRSIQAGKVPSGLAGVRMVLTVFIFFLAMLLIPFSSESWTRIGDYVDQVYESPHPYGPSDAGEGNILWQAIIHHPDASYIAIHFEKFELSGEDYLEISDPGGFYHHRYSGKGYMDSGNFWGMSVTGDTMILTIYGQGESQRGFGIYSDKYAYGFPLDSIGSPEALCGSEDFEDAICYENNYPAEYEKSRAVVKMLKNGADHCTGWLVSCENHMLTNEHCVTSQSELNSIEFQFMYQRPQCNSGTPVYERQTQGGTFLRDNSSLDYCLLIPTLNGNDYQDEYGYIQIDNRLPDLEERMYIPGHPSGDPKRLSILSTHSQDQTGFCEVYSTNESPCSGGPGDIGYYCDTEGGSSGSPVLSALSHKAIALHHCAYCPNRGVPITAVYADIQSSANPLPPCSTCEPGAAPTELGAVNASSNHVRITWQPVFGTIKYHVYRSRESCASGFYEIGTTTALEFSDYSVSGGFDYYYAVTSENDCGSESVYSNCQMIMATGNCIEKPQFDGATNAYTHHMARCALTIEWNPATTECGTEIVYSVYSSTQAGFAPSPDNLIAKCISGTSYFYDYALPGMNYFIVRAENNSPFGAGPCFGGMIDDNVVEVAAYAYGIATPGDFSDDMEAVEPNGWSHVSLIGTDDWAYSTAQAQSPSHSWFSANISSQKDVVLMMPKKAIGPTSMLSFYHYYDLEDGYDGGVIEISTDNGTNFTDLEPLITQGQYNDTISSGASSPIAGQNAWSGDSGGFVYAEVVLSSYNGQEVIIRFRNTSDGSVSSHGWYIDDVTLTDSFFFSPCVQEVPTLGLSGIVMILCFVSLVLVRRQ